MNIGEALYAYLKVDVDLSALISTRIYSLTLPQNCTMPAVTYRQISGPRVHTMGSDPGLTHPRFQFSCWGSSYGSAKDVARKLQAALQDYKGTMGGGGGVVVQASLLENELDIYDPDTKLYCVPLDFIIWHLE